MKFINNSNTASILILFFLSNFLIGLPKLATAQKPVPKVYKQHQQPSLLGTSVHIAKTGIISGTISIDKKWISSSTETIVQSLKKKIRINLYEVQSTGGFQPVKKY